MLFSSVFANAARLGSVRVGDFDFFAPLLCAARMFFLFIVSYS
jgi:hypothetical protein